MSTATVSFRVDAETAKAFHSAPPELQRKIELLLGLRLRELTAPGRPLKEIMDDLARKAEARGLTPAVLESLLHEE